MNFCASTKGQANIMAAKKQHGGKTPYHTIPTFNAPEIEGF